jgi:fatty acid desaturase
MSARSFFRHHPADAILAACGVAHVAVLLGTFAFFPKLPWWAIGLSFLTYAGMIAWNLQCISHNFIHNPFFAQRWLNRLFGVLESLAIGMPHQLYHHYHMNHHQGNNDAKGPDGSTRDWSSIYRHSAGEEPEPFWRYCLLSFFRVEIGPVLRVAIKHGPANAAQVAIETLAIALMWVGFALVDWRFFLFFYLPSYFLGWVISYAEGYLEHYGAQPGNPYADSVNSYNGLYNFLWFNNGYHQEHHWDPKCHWTRIKELHRQMLPQLIANQTRVLHGPHLTGLIEDWLKGNKPAPVPASEPAAQKRAA